MILDVTGVLLVPGNCGRECPGNGENPEQECCCEECDYMQCCLDPYDPARCNTCTDLDCPRKKKWAAANTPPACRLPSMESPTA